MQAPFSLNTSFRTLDYFKALEYNKGGWKNDDWRNNMKLKRIIAALAASAMLALTACSEDNGGNAPTGDATTTTTTQAAATTTTTAATTAAPESKVNVNFKTYTYTMKDAQDYEYEITLTLSPWILDTETEVLDSAWAKVGNGKTRPQMDSMGAQRYANNVYITSLSDSQGSHRTFYATMTNMYFSVGTVSVKNVTKGWDFTEQKTGTPKVALNWVSDFTRGQNLGNFALMTKTFYTSNENTDIGELYAKPKMTENSWGPATVVIAHAENISPKYPNGQYRDYVASGYFLADWAVNETKITIPFYSASGGNSGVDIDAGWGDGTRATTTTQAQTTTKSPSGAKASSSTLYVKDGAFFIDDSILGMNYTQLNSYFGENLPATKPWEWDKAYDSYLDYTFNGNMYSFFFKNNVLKGVRYEIIADNISTALVNTYRAKFGTFRNRTRDDGNMIPEGESGYGCVFTTPKGRLEVFENPYDNVGHVAMEYKYI